LTWTPPLGRASLRPGAAGRAGAQQREGSRHPKRWQDVEELLDAGIDVWSTMNVQHLESLNDIVSGITGIRVWETVPDRCSSTRPTRWWWSTCRPTSCWRA
jgi:hypothetical protein